MSLQVAGTAALRHSRAGARRCADLVVVGTGNVGSTLLDQIAARAERSGAGPDVRVVAIANSRRMARVPAGAELQEWRELLPRSGEATDLDRLLRSLDTGDRRLTLVDATACARVAARHAVWLRRGAHVVSANKLGCGGPLEGLQEIHSAAATGNARYAVSTTVGAGLPVLRTLTELVAGGDRIVSLRAACSGSLAYLFWRVDSGARFGDALREAISRGYTEPDPRVDLSGADVARKLLILARHCGHAPEHEAANVEGLVPDALASCDRAGFMARIDELASALAPRWAAARGRGCTLRYVGRYTPGNRVEVGLVELPADHPFARACGTDNVFEIATAHYRDRPIVIQGPGAGPHVTAAGLLRDILAVVREERLPTRE